MQGMPAEQGIEITFSNRIGVDFFDSQVPCVIVDSLILTTGSLAPRREFV
jgi:hypothetical protein